jgi:hypothetical protein
MMGGPEVLYERAGVQLVKYVNDIGVGGPWWVICDHWEDENAAEFASPEALQAFLSGALEVLDNRE